MIREQFQSLTPYQQEDYLNGGGEIESCNPEVISLPTVIAPQTESAELPSSAACVGVGCSTPTAPSVPVSFDLSRYDGFDIKDPVELLFLIDDNIALGKAKGGVDLHDWQIEFMVDFANQRWTDNDPFQAIVRAANGSGKDKYIIAACCVWLCMRYRKALGVVTSASGFQLDVQTCFHIKNMCEGANRKFEPMIGMKPWECNYRKYKCRFDMTGAWDSNVFCYATDEPLKAEGYHPTDNGTKMGIFVSEDKSVSDEINVALNKCTGYSHRVHASTPALPMGHFFDYSTTAISRRDIGNITECPQNKWIEWHITAYDCNHISPAYIQQMADELPGGRMGAAFRSQVEAEFGTTDEETVIPYQHLWRSINKPTVEHIHEELNIGGLDLSRGGDETVLTIRNGNKILAVIPFRFTDTEDSVEFLEEQFKKNKLTSPKALIFADAGGLGSPIIDRLKGRGWTNLRYVFNQSRAYNSRVYRNRGAEMWFEFAKLVEKNEILFSGVREDKRLTRQLATRYYKRVTGEQHQLESKLQAKSRGHPSPDRADSVVLCFSNYESKLDFTSDALTEKPFALPEEEKESGDFLQKNWASDSQKKWQPEQQHDFSYIESEIADYNKQLQLNRKN